MGELGFILNLIFDVIVAILVYEYLKRNRKVEAFATAVILKIAFYISFTVIMGQFSVIPLIIYLFVTICVARLYTIIVTAIYDKKMNPVLFVVIASIIGMLILSVANVLLSDLLTKLVLLFGATFQYSLDQISK